MRKIKIKIRKNYELWKNTEKDEMKLFVEMHALTGWIVIDRSVGEKYLGMDFERVGEGMGWGEGAEM